MDKEQELIARGAEYVAGDLMLNRKTVGMHRHGQFILTADGAEELETEPLVAVTPMAKAAGVKPKTRAKRTALGPALSKDAPDAPDDAAIDVDDAAIDVDDLLDE